MKRIFIFATFLAISLCVSAQKEKISSSFEILKDESVVDIMFSFKETVFEKKFNEEQWIEIHGEDEWNKAKEEAMQIIVSNVNEKLRKQALFVKKHNPQKNCHYTIIVAPIKLDRNGNNVSYYYLRDNTSNTIIARKKINGDGGRFGDLANLLGDGYEEAARSLGRSIKSDIDPVRFF